MESNNNTLDSNSNRDNTTTFIVGFAILLIFIVLGLLASAFLCIILKKDQYLWEVERERQLQENEENNDDENLKERDKINLDGNVEGEV